MKSEELEKKLEEYIENLRIYGQKQENTLIKYTQVIRDFIKWLEEKELTQAVAISYPVYLKDSTIDKKAFETSTVNTNIKILNEFFKYLELDIHIKQIKQQIKYNNKNVLTLEEVHRLQRKAKENNNMRLYYIMEILLKTGIRVGELKYFTVENLQAIDNEEPELIVYNKGKERPVTVIPELKNELLKYAKKENITTGTIFPSQRAAGKMLTASAIWKQMQKTAAACKIKKVKVHAHSFRHLFAQLYSQQDGASTEELADIFGHSNTNTTRTYMRTSAKEKKRRIQGVNFGQKPRKK